MSVREFYAGQEIFITGGTGFVGKVLIEKIIRSLPNFGKIFILIRTKKGKTPSQRLEEVLCDPLYKRAHTEQPQAFKNIEAIAGDVQQLGLGISAEDLERIKNVTMIFHSAATVRFDDHLKSAILLNTRGTHEMVKIAEKLPKLKAFLHVSTTYAHPDIYTLDEKIYPPYADWRTTIKLAETYDTDTLNTFFPLYSPGHPNSYTFTKSLSEHVINDYRHKIPAAIMRLSIVVNTAEEPVPGWIDNFNGPVGLLVACGVGLFRTNHADPDVVSDFIPVDICARGLIVAGFKVGSQQFEGVDARDSADLDQVEVINCSNSTMSRISTGEIINMGKDLAFDNPFEKAIWLPEGSITRCAVWHYLRLVTLQLLPALLIDCLLRLAKHPPFLLRLQRRLYATNRALYLFLITEWTFINDNLKKLDSLIHKDEISTFGVFIYAGYAQRKFFTDGLKGAKEFLLKEPPIATKQTRIRMHIYRVLHYTLQYVSLYYIARYICRCVYSYIMVSDS